MGFYIRKSIRLGPVRFNLSKSGVGASIGVKGFTIGSGPRGNYIHAGCNGFYYRTSLSSSKPAKQTLSPPSVIQNPVIIPSGAHDPLVEIESSDILQMVNTSSAELLNEINNKLERMRIWPLVATLAVVTLFAGNHDFTPRLFSAGIIATFGAYYYDQQRKTVVMFYDFEPERELLFKAMHDTFQGMMDCKGSWHINSQGAVRDRKYHAGASSVVKRNNIRLSIGQPPFVKTNIDVPIIPVGKQTLYFFPDRLFVFEKSMVGAVSYNDLRIYITPSKFIEDEKVPNDALIVDRTWRYVNKKGRPDKRFKDNREMPIVLYEESHFQSSNGLNEIINLSKCGTVRNFHEAITKIASWR